MRMTKPKIVPLAAGRSYSVALTKSGKVVHWGRSEFTLHDVRKEAQSNVIAISAGQDHIMALTKAGRALAWGDRARGQCQHQNDPAYRVGIIAISAGESQCLCVQEDVVYGWGPTLQDNSSIPQEAQAGMIDVACGAYHNLGLTREGKVLAWQRDPKHDVSDMIKVPAQAQSGITAISAGIEHSMALTSGGEVLVWGPPGIKQLDIPAKAKAGVTAISAGGKHCLALTKDGEVLAWGDNSEKQLEVPDAAKTGVIAIAAGEKHSLALTKEGKVLAWYSNEHDACTIPNFEEELLTNLDYDAFVASTAEKPKDEPKEPPKDEPKEPPKNEPKEQPKDEPAKKRAEEEKGPPWVISPPGGDVPSAAVGQPFDEPLMVEVRREGELVKNGTIRFEVKTKGAATFPGDAQSCDVQTDENGRATALDLKAGTTPGDVLIKVTAPNYQHTPATLKVTVEKPS